MRALLSLRLGWAVCGEAADGLEAVEKGKRLRPDIVLMDVAGHLCVVTEEMDRVIGERRLRTLRSLASELSTTITEDDVCASIFLSLGENLQDLPFTLTYLLTKEGDDAYLAFTSGIAAGHPVAPHNIRSTAANQAWPAPSVQKHQEREHSLGPTREVTSRELS
jgi:DNA-binding NarL/FixJ family response regulator